MDKELDHISVVGAREHNLKNVSVTFPKKSLVVMSGVSGSGKSSLAFDTIFAEGQRRYVESLSAYARQFLGQAEKPKYETIRGLSPTIAIEQKTAGSNPRSTVGTITEVYDYLRVLFARTGVQHCIHCHKKVSKGDAASLVEQIRSTMQQEKIILLAPLVDNRKGEHKDIIGQMQQDGLTRARVDGVISELADIQALAKNKKHSIEAVVDRLIVKEDVKFARRLQDSLELALKMGSGQVLIHFPGSRKKDLAMSTDRTCCGVAYPELNPPLFSFNSPLGMCSHCNGLGSVLAIDPQKVVPDPELTIREGAVLPWKSFFHNGVEKESSWGMRRIKAMQKKWKISLDTPWKKMPKKHRDIILNGAEGETLRVKWQGSKGEGSWDTEEDGILNRLLRRYKQSQSDAAKEKYACYLSQLPCEHCSGQRLKDEVLAVKFRKKSIIELCEFSITDVYQWFCDLELKGSEQVIATELVKEIRNRLHFLVNVGLGYLSLARKGPTLSGGEAQRIRLASQIGSELTGVLYVLDEPSIGLHQQDNRKLIETLTHLRDIGNTVLVIEHDRETLEAADWLVDIGPGAGHLGGEIMYSGPAKKVYSSRKSLTGRFLSGQERIFTGPGRPLKAKHPQIKVIGARENNLKKIDVTIPLERFVSISGVSGAGKSTFINQILFPALSNKLHGSTLSEGQYSRLTGVGHIDKIINVDQKPIGRTPRSNPATYTKLFDHIRDLFAMLPESRARGYSKGRFSFNVPGGRCEHCKGDGQIKVEMHFLPDVYVQCQNCQGRRFNDATLDIRYKGYSIADVLDMTARQAMEVLGNYPKIKKILQTLLDVGLDYVHLGQAATTLSGGEAQRIKLARELAKRDTGRTLYILDEPTTGLHFADINKLLSVLHTLVDMGNSVLVIEHNLDVIRSSDWVIDLGPEGGRNGGYIIAEGTPQTVAKVKKSPTGRFLNECLR